MVGLLVTGHGHFATGLGSSLQLIAGENPSIQYVDFEADHSTETLTANLNTAFDKMKDCDGVLVLADLAGGSPFKCAAECKFARPDQKIEVVAGTNLPMLIEASMSMPMYTDPDTMADAVTASGKDFIIKFVLETHEDNAEEDGI